MSQLSGIFNASDALKMESLNQRLTRQHVVTGNIANAETPGFRALGYDFEKQLQAIADGGDPFPMKATNPKHFMNGHTEADGTIYPDVLYALQKVSARMAIPWILIVKWPSFPKTKFLYRATVELLNKKIGTLKYAVSAGGR